MLSAFRLLFALIILGTSLSCESNDALLKHFSNVAYHRLKAQPATLSPFIMQSGAVALRQVNVGAFHYAWENADPALITRIAQAREIAIAPVDIRYLRFIKPDVLPGQKRPPPVKDDQAAAILGEEMRKQFATAFLNSPRPRFRWVRNPTPNSLILELSIIELNPTSVMGNSGKAIGNMLTVATGGVSKLATYLMIDPAIEAAFPGQALRGNIAIEGRLRLPDDGRIIYEFADREQDPLTLVSVRDYRPYAHAMNSITNWATQFEELSRTRVVPDTPVFRFNPL